MKRIIDWNYLKSFKRSYYVYAGILVGFIIWMVFIDTHSWNIHSELNSEIERLEQEKEALKLIMSSDKKTFKQLQNIDSLEHFARENYGHKKENETIFIIETGELEKISQ
jgi:cell division protein FtsB